MFHPRWVFLLSDPALLCLCHLLFNIERTGLWPEFITLLCLVKKRLGGWRTVGALSFLYRLWAKLRLSIAHLWEASQPRRYLAAGSGKSSVDMAFDMLFDAEVSRARGESALAALLDLEKFYEHIEHWRLADAAQRHGFSVVVVRLCIAVYAAGRRIKLRGCLSSQVFSTKGVVAGCSWAFSLQLWSCSSHWTCSRTPFRPL